MRYKTGTYGEWRVEKDGDEAEIHYRWIEEEIE